MNQTKIYEYAIQSRSGIIKNFRSGFNYSINSQISYAGEMVLIISKREINQAAALLGRIGGAAGRGDSKRRSPEHYQKMVEVRRLNKIENKSK